MLRESRPRTARRGQLHVGRSVCRAVASGNFLFFAADDERKGVLITELPREDLLRSSRTLRRRTITVDAPHRRAGEEKEAYSNAPCAPEVQMGGDLYTVAKKKAAKKAKKKK
ncbi:MAG TPA: hypothetical protein VGQ96_07360 [Candidatus Eremiobacteraceae bacterium]|nr:hypothetical protein [Candidatus Eremiobacteraceae bacterium]